MTLSAPFTITTPADTDLWRKPPQHNATNAPVNIHTTIPLTKFQRVRTSVSANWTQRYDQGGFVLKLTRAGSKDKWLKAGVEFYNDRPFISTVCTDNWSDWSVAPPVLAEGEKAGGEVIVEAIRQGDELGSGLWVYQIVKGKDGKEEKIPLREVAWFFADEQEWTLEVGAYAARPGTEGGELEVSFGLYEFEQLND